MYNIKVETSSVFSGNPDELKSRLIELIHENYDDNTYDNTEASIHLIINGCIDYFFNLDENFLGEGNGSGIPDPKADYFANNIYRLTNAINYLSKLRKIKTSLTDEMKLLLDIRTLIVHSGEQITKINSFKLENYKDSQLGNIFSRKYRRAFHFQNEYSKMDYCIQIWNDKHDKKQQHHKSEIDFHIKNNSYLDISIYLKHEDVKHIVLSYINDFFSLEPKIEKSKKFKRLPEKIKYQIIDTENHKIDFAKIATLISSDTRGGYIIENEIAYWNDFGLERLYNFTKLRPDIPIEIREMIFDKIENIMLQFWNDYQDREISDDKIISLNIMTIFGQYTPTYEGKSYLENQKLFLDIAPFFNAKDRDDSTDIDYLFKFICSISKSLEKK